MYGIDTNKKIILDGLQYSGETIMQKLHHKQRARASLNSVTFHHLEAKCMSIMHESIINAIQRSELSKLTFWRCKILPCVN